MARRAIASGPISFGLVSVPIGWFGGTQFGEIAFDRPPALGGAAIARGAEPIGHPGAGVSFSRLPGRVAAARRPRLGQCRASGRGPR